MKKNEVKLGNVYAVKVSGKVVPVRIDQEYERAGRRIAYSNDRASATAWKGTNLYTSREVHIRSAAKLRFEMERDPAMSSRWIQKMPEHWKLARRLINEMGSANNCTFKTTKEQRTMLREGVERMLKAGFQATDEDIELVTDGDQDEREQKFKSIDGFDLVNQTLGTIFNGPQK